MCFERRCLSLRSSRYPRDLRGQRFFERSHGKQEKLVTAKEAKKNTKGTAAPFKTGAIKTAESPWPARLPEFSAMPSPPPPARARRYGRQPPPSVRQSSSQNRRFPPVSPMRNPRY